MNGPSVLVPGRPPARPPTAGPRARTQARTRAHPLPVVPVRARGMTVEAADGRRYLDCLSGAGTLALGHNHPAVLAALRSALPAGPDPYAVDPYAPDPGSPDAAPVAARAPGAGRGPVSVLGAFTDALLTTLSRGLAEDAAVRFCGPRPADALAEAAALVRHATGRPGMLVAPVLAADDVTVTPDEWLRRARALTAERGVPLIAYETRTGVGRTGEFWAVAHSGVVPDVMVLSDAIGGGLPLSCVVYRRSWGGPPGGERAGGGVDGAVPHANRLAIAAGTATLHHVHHHGLARRAATVGERILGRLRALRTLHQDIGGVRGRGLMIGVELAAPRLAEAVRHEALRRGLIVEPAGRQRRVIRLMPPLTITDEQADAVTDRLADAVAAALRTSDRPHRPPSATHSTGPLHPRRPTEPDRSEPAVFDPAVPVPHAPVPALSDVPAPAPGPVVPAGSPGPPVPGHAPAPSRTPRPLPPSSAPVTAPSALRPYDTLHDQAPPYST